MLSLPQPQYSEGGEAQSSDAAHAELEAPASPQGVPSGLGDDEVRVSVLDDAGGSPSGSARRGSDDDLDAKILNTIERARLSFKERQLHRAVEALETQCELLKESHRRKARDTATELCSHITHLLVDAAATACESGRTERLLRNQRTICEKLQTANELVDAERLAMEYQKYEKETELEEVNFKFVELKEKYDLQESLHQKEQRAFEQAAQDLKIKYEKHFKSLSSEIENLQKKCSSIEGQSKARIGDLAEENESLQRDLEATTSDLTRKNKALATEVESKTSMAAKLVKECTDLTFIVDSMERNLVGLEGIGISDLLAEILATTESVFGEFAAFSRQAATQVREMKSESTRVGDQMLSSQVILSAMVESLGERKRAQRAREAALAASNEDLRKENKALAIKSLGDESRIEELSQRLAKEKRMRTGYQDKYLAYREAETPLRSAKTPRGLALGSLRKQKPSETEAGEEAFYTPIGPSTDSSHPLPFARSGAPSSAVSPVRMNPREEEELELLGQLDAQRTFEDVEKQVYQILKEERTQREGGRTTEEIVAEIIRSHKHELGRLMTSTELLKTSKKKLDVLYS